MLGRDAMAEHAAQASSPATSTSRNTTARVGHFAGRSGLHVLAILLGLILMLPFFWAISSSLKQIHEVRQIPPVLWPAVPQWQNYANVLSSSLFQGWALNSVYLTVVATTGVLVSSSLAGFAFARHRFPGRALLFS